jgi:signal transduction histidine kinase
MLFSISAPLRSQDSPIKITSFDFSLLPGEVRTLAGIVDKDNILFFANQSGVLIYDGSKWQLVRLPNYAMVYSLCLVKDIVYVGGVNEFGFLKKNRYGDYIYSSLRQTVPQENKLSNIWQVKAFKGDIYFQTHEKIIRWDGENSFIIEEYNKYLFNVGDQLIASGFGSGLYSMGPAGSKLLNDAFTFGEDAIYAITPLEQIDSSYLIISGEKGEGAYTYWPHRNHHFVSWDRTEVGDFLAVNPANFATNVNDNVLAISCSGYGLILADKQGQILRKIRLRDGLLSAAVNELVVDNNGILWVTTDAGISKIQWDQILSKAKNKTLITKVLNGDSALVMEDLATTPFELDNKIEIDFATPGFDNYELLYNIYLEGADETWIGWEERKSAIYAGLEAGSYTFYVKSKRLDGIEISEAALYFEIINPWYQHSLARVIAIMIVLVVVVLVYFLINRFRNSLADTSKELDVKRKLLNKTSKELEVTHNELDQFVYRASHDLVAPLKSVRGLINLAKHEPTSKVVEEYHHLMEVSILKLEEFIKNIMEYSVNSNLKLTYEMVELERFTSELLNDIQFYPGFSEIEVKTTFDVKELYSDRRRLHIILSNYITNAIKYHDFARKPEIIVSSEEVDSGVLIKVIDNGPGIETEHLDKVFDMFYRARQDSKGSGLGLYIVKESAEIIGAKVWIESKWRQGTAAFLLIPSADSQVDFSLCKEN